MSERQAFRDVILQDEGIQRLLERLANVEQFHAVMVMCDMPRVANAIVDMLNAELPRLRDEPIRLVHMDPYRAHKNIMAPIPLDLLNDEVLGPLVHPTAENQGPSVVTVVDASRAMPQDDETWGMLFQRMNERRNAIGRALASALVFVVPRRYEGLFAHAAPDFWSILGAATIVQTPPIEDEPGLMVAWDDLLEQKNDPAAMQNFEESIELLAPPQLEMAKDLVIMALAADAYLSGGSLYAKRAQFPAALGDLERSILLSQRLIGLDPNQIEPIKQLALALSILGNVHFLMGTIDDAIDAYMKSIGHWRRLVIVGDASMNASRYLGVTLGKLGDAYRAKGDLNRALVSYDEAAEINRITLTRKPGDLNALRLLVLILGKTSRAYVVRGDFDRCRVIAEEGLDAARKWLDAQPDEIEAQRHCRWFEAVLALSHEELGRYPEPIEHVFERLK